MKTVVPNTALRVYSLAQLWRNCSNSHHRSPRQVIRPEELAHSRPRWESWLVAEAKRRTSYSVSLLENVFNFANGDVSHLAEELAMLPAPYEKRLWEARNREAWIIEYDVNLQRWKGRGLQMHEFWPKVEGEEERKQRVHEWAEEVDEFEMMMLAVCTITHGS